MPAFDHGYALLVGVGADLPSTLRDAERMAGLLRDPSRCGYRAENVRVLRGPAATREELLAGLEWLAHCSREDPEATIIFYFSGHGLGGPEATLVLHPCFDADGRAQPGLFAEKGLPGELLCRQLDAIVSTKLIVLLDCCYATAQVETFKDPAREPDFLDRLRSGTGRVVLASSTDYERAATAGRESYFTAALLEGLAGYGSYREDGFAKLFDIVDWVMRSVRQRSRERQHPVFRGSEVNENFAVAYYAGGETRARDLGLASRVPRRAYRLETETEQAVFAQLDTAREDSLMVENEIAARGGIDKAPPALAERRRDAERRIFEAEAKLGLLEQQAPFYQHLSSWWGRVGAASFLASVFCLLGSQKAFDHLVGTRPPTFAVLGLVLSGAGLSALFWLVATFQRQATRGDWFYRLPVAFGYRSIFYDRNFARRFQAASLLAFIAVPLYSQGHFLKKVGEETVFQAYEINPHAATADRDLELRGFAHLTRAFGFTDAFFTGSYYLGSYSKGQGITFFPFWEPWILVVLFFLWLALFGRCLLRLARKI